MTARKPLKIKGFLINTHGKKPGKVTCQAEGRFAKVFAVVFMRIKAVKTHFDAFRFPCGLSGSADSFFQKRLDSDPASYFIIALPQARRQVP